MTFRLLGLKETVADTQTQKVWSPPANYFLTVEHKSATQTGNRERLPSEFKLRLSASTNRVQKAQLLQGFLFLICVALFQILLLMG